MGEKKFYLPNLKKALFPRISSSLQPASRPWQEIKVQHLGEKLQISSSFPRPGACPDSPGDGPHPQKPVEVLRSVLGIPFSGPSDGGEDENISEPTRDKTQGEASNRAGRDKASSRLVDSDKEQRDVNMRRALVLRALPVYLREDAFKFFRTCNSADGPDLTDTPVALLTVVTGDPTDAALFSPESISTVVI
ncbi:hypothetical protein E1301_Tti017106 [Triplophysa tibetana]|uniref:Uncharacterized protein n=1 Tax=Triplophysa tibetana TaxID=1572043 RepID=A0A5A9NWI9_9TELE|nr:hypothetical protein E1301_Tti017106 [Triplophysa tibetana]